MRITSKENKHLYDGSVKWLKELAGLGIPIPQILRHGQYDDVSYTLITYINGKDLGEVYRTLNDSQKHAIAKEIAGIQRKVSAIPPVKIDGSSAYSSATYMGGIKKSIQRSRDAIAANGVFNPDVCDAVADLMNKFEDYFAAVKPLPFLDDISTKNVLIRNGRLAGIVDIDEMGYGDPLTVVGLTNMALLAMKADTIYIDSWLDEMRANAVQRKAEAFYTLLSCIDFMGERGAQFVNGMIVPVKQEEVELFNSIYHELLDRVKQ